jgi:predicted enzyme related to lactoylglutathione lyase
MAFLRDYPSFYRKRAASAPLGWPDHGGHMPAILRHISINADDVERARRFYAAVFGWSFQPWGPPGFYQIIGAGVGGGLQNRREIAPGARMLGVEATMAVDDPRATLAAIEAAGGRIVTQPVHIHTVGTLIWFEDTEGNIAGAMRYDAPDQPRPESEPGGPAPLRHFAINADDVQRAKRFYEAVFGWTFEPWRPPDFYIVRNAGRTFNGALQGRRELKPGARMLGFEASIGVPDINALVAAVEAGGGATAMRPVHIETVGTVCYFEDTEGNLLGACQYDPGTSFE